MESGTDNQLIEELALARAEEAEALKRAMHVRCAGTHAELQAALREVDAAHARVCRLDAQLRAVKVEEAVELSAAAVPRRT